jgi:hypothetical protein
MSLRLSPPAMSDEPPAMLCSADGVPYTIVNGKPIFMQNQDGTPYQQAPVIPHNEDGTPHFPYGCMPNRKYIMLRRTSDSDDIVPANMLIQQIERIAYNLHASPTLSCHSPYTDAMACRCNGLRATFPTSRCQTSFWPRAAHKASIKLCCQQLLVL